MDFPENRFPGLIPSTLSAVVNSSCPLLGFIGRLSPVTGAASAAAIIIVTVAVPGFLYLKKNKNKLPRERHNVRGESTDAAPTFDPLLNGISIYAFINFFPLILVAMFWIFPKSCLSFIFWSTCAQSVHRRKRQLRAPRCRVHTGFGEPLIHGTRLCRISFFFYRW